MKNFNIKNNKIFILKELVFILILFVMLFSFDDVYAATITYETYGGNSIESTIIDDNTSIGVMPVPTKSGKIFTGWFLEDTYDTKVTSSYIVTGDTTLHAKWENDNFPIVWKKLKSCIFNGKDHNISGEDCQEYSNGKYIDTGIMLYDTTNHDLDYEIGFKIEHYEPSEQDANIPQQTFVNTKLEGDNYPGLVFRRNADKLEIASRRTSSANSSHQEKYEDWTDVRIYRVSKTIYYSVNEVEKHDLNGLYNFNPEFNLNVWFGAAPKNAQATTAQRFLNATLSNMYIKVGTFEDKENYIVYKPDGTEDVVEKYSDYDLSTVDSNKNDKKIATVTFKYHNDDPDTLAYVKTQYINNGWTVFDTDYENQDSIQVIKDAVLYPKYVESTIGAEFPSNPTRDHYTFDGWYTLEDGGELVTSYNETSDIVLHAHWSPIYPTDFTLSEDNVELIVGETHQIGVTFIPNNESDTLTFDDYDNSLISVSNSGLITALSSGTTTITVGLEHIDVTKTITVTVVSNELESNLYEIMESPNNVKVIITPETTITAINFKNNMINSNINLNIYDEDDAIINDHAHVRTGDIIKFEYNGEVLDEAIIIIKGDVNGDGSIDSIDYSEVLEHYLENTEIEDYIYFKAGDIETDDILNLMDLSKIQDYYL